MVVVWGGTNGIRVACFVRQAVMAQAIHSRAPRDGGGAHRGMVGSLGDGVAARRAAGVWVRARRRRRHGIDQWCCSRVGSNGSSVDPGRARCCLSAIWSDHKGASAVVVWGDVEGLRVPMCAAQLECGRRARRPCRDLDLPGHGMEWARR